MTLIKALSLLLLCNAPLSLFKSNHYPSYKASEASSGERSNMVALKLHATLLRLSPNSERVHHLGAHLGVELVVGRVFLLHGIHIVVFASLLLAILLLLDTLSFGLALGSRPAGRGLGDLGRGAALLGRGAGSGSRRLGSDTEFALDLTKANLCRGL